MLRRIKKIAFVSFLELSLGLSACTTPVSTAVDPTPTTIATPIPTTSEQLTPPSLLYIANNQLYEQQADGTSSVRADLGEQGEILDAVRVDNLVFVLWGKGLQQIDMATGKTKMAVEFDKVPLWGELERTSDEHVLLYSIALDSACSSTGIGAAIGLYQVNQDTARDVLVKDEGYIKPLGLATDRQSIYGLPLGCDPEFDRFWLISIDQGKITKELQTGDVTSQEYGEGYAALSPDAHFLAFLSMHHVEDSPRYRLSLYDLGGLTLKRYELPNPPSYTGELLWSPTGQELYFILNPGTPYDESSESYGLWNLDIHTDVFSPVTRLESRYMHLVTISSDGQWILLQPETEPSITYVYLPTGQQFVMNLPSEGLNHIVR